MRSTESGHDFADSCKFKAANLQQSFQALWTAGSEHSLCPGNLPFAFGTYIKMYGSYGKARPNASHGEPPTEHQYGETRPNASYRKTRPNANFETLESPEYEGWTLLSQFHAHRREPRSCRHMAAALVSGSASSPRRST